MLLFIIFGLTQVIEAQNEENRIEISLLTCTSGSELYSTFGHSAIRIKDYQKEKDVVFDFGVFDFNTPFFLWKFLRGNLMYQLDKKEFEDFILAYEKENREVVEERLNLPEWEKYALYNQLILNNLPENKSYRYDFLYDNCSTRIRDLIENTGTVQMPDSLLQKQLKQSFRDNLNQYLVNKQWIKLGIDLLLGTPVDKEMSYFDQMFLPKNLSENLAHYKVNYNGHPTPLLSPAKELLGKTRIEKSVNFISPTTFFLGFLLVICLLMLIQPHTLGKISPYLYLIYGGTGCFLLFMWFGSNLSATKSNWNLLWVNPLYLLLYFLKKKTVKILTLSLTSLMCFSTLFCWNLLTQQLNQAIIPLAGIILALNAFSFLTMPKREKQHR